MTAGSPISPSAKESVRWLPFPFLNAPTDKKGSLGSYEQASLYRFQGGLSRKRRIADALEKSGPYDHTQ
jgi:hypothetical protein